MGIEGLLRRIEAARVAVIGDYCLDVYWLADMTRSVLSRETPHHPLPVMEERMSPGGAGNVAANAAALKPAGVAAIGVIGRDWRGEALVRLLQGQGVDTSGLLVSPERVTNAYIKPLRRGIADTVYEDPRLDFENHQQQSEATDRQLCRLVEGCDADVLCVSDQMACGCITGRVRDLLCTLGKAGRTIIVDSRERIGLYRDVIIKPNAVEAARALGSQGQPEMMIRRLASRTDAPVVLTLGENGSLVFEKGLVTRVAAHTVPPPIDICGAGDTFMAALACALAGGASLPDAARLGSVASSVTIRKLSQTGTATPEEILAALAESGEQPW